MGGKGVPTGTSEGEGQKIVDLRTVGEHGKRMEFTMYEYKGCGTCRKARKWLAEREVEVTLKPIRETPPTEEELARMLGFLDGEVRRLFNTSGGDYREMNLKEKLPGMSEAEMFALLAANGNLVKRPFLIGAEAGTTGFKEAEWEALIGG